ncbi:MAG: hypothetical protein FGM38_03985 [Solirubrobacterales bacterium]|nr:hypothetical protein [Solirubrobacterales bacterium]
MESNQMDKKALAKAKLEARKLRISNLRKRIAIFSASLALLFSGLVVGLNGVPLLFGGKEQPTTEVVQTEGAEQQVGATIIAFASGLVFDEDDDEEEEGGFFSTGNSRSSSSSSSPSVTTSQS